jgi:hypothetical protein
VPDPNVFYAGPISITDLVAGESYVSLDTGLLRLLMISGYHYLGTEGRDVFSVRYVCRGHRANGDPAATIDVQPRTSQSLLLEHLAKAAAELPLKRARPVSSTLLGVCAIFEELQRFFRVYRFDWSEQSGLQECY